MNIYKRFSNYLVERSPLLWHSKFVPLMAAVILLNIISFIAGYGLMSYEKAMTTSISDFFTDSNYSTIFGIMVFILITIWLLAYFKNVSIKKFYPVSHFYIWGIFLLNFTALSMLCFCYFSFTTGAALKGRSYLSVIDLKKTEKKIRLAEPFLGLEYSKYNFENRRWPTIYDTVQYFNFENTPNRFLTEFYTEKSGIPKRFIFEKTANNWFQYNEKNHFIYKGYEIEDSCVATRTYIDNVISKNALPNFQFSHILNFSFDEENVVMDNTNDSVLLLEKQICLAQIHKWILNDDATQIKTTLEDLKKEFKKYELKGSYQEDSVYQAWKQIGYNANRVPLMVENLSDYPDQYSPEDAAAAAVEAAASTATTTATVDTAYDGSMEETAEIVTDRAEEENARPIYFAKQKYYAPLAILKNRVENLVSMHNYSNSSTALFICLTIAFVFSLLIAVFEIGPPLQVLISIPVFGVISLIFILGRISIFQNWDSTEYDIYKDNSGLINISLALTCYTLIAGISWIGIHTRKLSKRVTSVFFHILFVLTPALPIALLAFIRELFRDVIIVCKSPTVVYPFEIESPLLMLILAFIGFLFISLFVKNYLAKEE